MNVRGSFPKMTFRKRRPPGTSSSYYVTAPCFFGHGQIGASLQQAGDAGETPRASPLPASAIWTWTQQNKQNSARVKASSVTSSWLSKALKQSPDAWLFTTYLWKASFFNATWLYLSQRHLGWLNISLLKNLRTIFLLLRKHVRLWIRGLSNCSRLTACLFK